MSTVVNENTQYVDVDGKPVVNGFVYFGDANSDPKLNPKSIFSNSDLTTALANPQRTDAYGRVVNKVWLDGDYSLRVSDVNDVQLYQELNNGTPSVGGVLSLTGAAGSDTITASTVVGITAYVDKQLYIFDVALDNTGAVTLNVDGLGAKEILREVGKSVNPGEFEATQTIIVVYNSVLDKFLWVNAGTKRFTSTVQTFVVDHTPSLDDVGNTYIFTALSNFYFPPGALGASFTIKAKGAAVYMVANGTDTVDDVAIRTLQDGESVKADWDASASDWTLIYFRQSQIETCPFSGVPGILFNSTNDDGIDRYAEIASDLSIVLAAAETAKFLFFYDIEFSTVLFSNPKLAGADTVVARMEGIATGAGSVINPSLPNEGHYAPYTSDNNDAPLPFDLRLMQVEIEFTGPGPFRLRLAASATSIAANRDLTAIISNPRQSRLKP